MNTKLKLLSGILAVTLTSTASANLVTDWTYVNQAGFNAFTGTTATAYAGDDVVASGDSAGGIPADNILDTNASGDVTGADSSISTALTWGTPAAGAPNPQSGMSIDSPIVGAMETNGAWAQGTSITHDNFVIIGDSLISANVLDGLQISPSAWTTTTGNETDLTDNSPYFAPQLEFGINFFETPNGGNPCGDGGANGSGDNINGCGDIFELTGLELLPFTPVTGADFISFTVPFTLQDSLGDALEGWGDTQYFVTTRLSGLTTLPDSYTCSNAQPDCFGFVTIEEQSNVLNAEFRIHTQRPNTSVPEPSGIALLALGLLGLASRKKRSV